MKRWKKLNLMHAKLNQWKSSKVNDKRFQWVEKHEKLKKQPSSAFFKRHNNECNEWERSDFTAWDSMDRFLMLMCYTQSLLCVIHLLQRLTCFRRWMTKIVAATRVSFSMRGKNVLSSGEILTESLEVEWKSEKCFVRLFH